jgi:hypothetical protein
LFVVGTALLVGVGLAYVLGYRGGPPAHPVAATTTAPTTAPTPPTFAIERASARPSSYAATIVWETPEPSTARLQWGPAKTVPVLWTTDPKLTTRHSVTLPGLASSAEYGVTIVASSLDGESAQTTLSFTTAGSPAAKDGAIRDGTLLVHGEPLFPLIAWQQCRDQLDSRVATGIDLFAGTQCTSLPDLITGLNGRALVAGTDEDLAADPASLVGWFYPDEADARGYSGATLPATPPGIRFLTITAHFFSGAAPLPTGRAVYPSLVDAADVVGFDFYPLQELCRPDLLPFVFDAQQELEALAPGKPTFQWIEARTMRCGDTGPSAVTPATIRAESWLAVAAGARGLAYFPPDWQSGADVVIGGVIRRIRQLEPALLQPALPVDVLGSATVRASARAYDAALYVIAVNAGYTASDVRLTLPQLGDRPLLVLGGEDRLAAQDGVIIDRLPPLGVRIYVAPPA